MFGDRFAFVQGFSPRFLGSVFLGLWQEHLGGAGVVEQCSSPHGRLEADSKAELNTHTYEKMNKSKKIKLKKLSENRVWI